MDLVQSKFLQALGWSLIDSVWQMGILWLVYLVLTGKGRRHTPKIRHSIALLSITGGASWFLAELVFNLLNPGQLAFDGARHNLVQNYLGFSSSIEPVVPFLSIVYLLVCFTLFIKLISQYRNTRNLTRQRLYRISPAFRLFTEKHARQLQIGRKVQIWLSAHVDSPLTIGFWKPMIILPLAAVNKLSVEQVEAVILHELNHIRRHDYLVNLLVTFSTVVLFFNPFARVLSTILRNEREHSCDDLVLQFEYKPLQYAEALLLLERDRNSLNHVQLQATGSSGGHLMQRVKRILTGEQPATPLSHRMLAVFFGFLLIGFVGWYRPSSQLSEALLPSLADGFVRMESIEKITETPIRHSPNPPGTRLLLNTIIPLSLKKVPGPSSDLNPPEPELVLDTEIAEYPDDPTAQFSAAGTSQQYSIYETKPDHFFPASPNTGHPYVPSSTLEFAVLEDTLVPSDGRPGIEELEARDAMEKAMLALDEIDWLKLDLELKSNGNKTDIATIQKQLKQAIREVNWRKIHEQLDRSSAKHRETQALNEQLQNYRQQLANKQKQLSIAQEQALMDRLNNIQSNTSKAKKIISL